MQGDVATQGSVITLLSLQLLAPAWPLVVPCMTDNVQCLTAFCKSGMKELAESL